MTQVGPKTPQQELRDSIDEMLRSLRPVFRLPTLLALLSAEISREMSSTILLSTIGDLFRLTPEQARVGLRALSELESISQQAAALAARASSRPMGEK